MSVKEEVLGIIGKSLEVAVDELVEDKKLYDSIGVDSTEMVEIVISLGKHFGIKIETNEVTKFSTPAEVVALIENKKSLA
jgi:acyl carrier protein